MSYYLRAFHIITTKARPQHRELHALLFYDKRVGSFTSPANQHYVLGCSELYKTSSNRRLENAGLNAPEELLRCWECTEKIKCVF